MDDIKPAIPFSPPETKDEDVCAPLYYFGALKFLMQSWPFFQTWPPRGMKVFSYNLVKSVFEQMLMMMTAKDEDFCKSWQPLHIPLDKRECVFLYIAANKADLLKCSQQGIHLFLLFLKIFKTTNLPTRYLNNGVLLV